MKFQLIDIFGNRISNYNITELIEKSSAGTLKRGSYITPFIVKKGRKIYIENRVGEVVDESLYWTDLLCKLRRRQGGSITSCILTSTDSEFQYYDILNHALINKSKIPLNIEKGGDFEVCYLGITSTTMWRGEVLTSLDYCSFEVDNKVFVFNPLTNCYLIDDDSYNIDEVYNRILSTVKDKV